MNTPTIPREELKENLSERILFLEQVVEFGDTHYAVAEDTARANQAKDELPLLRACLTELERGEADTRRLDWLEESSPKCAYHGAWQVQIGGYESNCGLVRAILCDDHPHKTVREALDVAMGGEKPYEGL
jgi:hypothetical protein